MQSFGKETSPVVHEWVTSHISCFQKCISRSFLWFPERANYSVSLFFYAFQWRSQLMPRGTIQSYWEQLPYSLKYNCEWFACFHHRTGNMRHVYIQTELCVFVCVYSALSESRRNPVFPSHSSHGEKFLSSHSVTQMLLSHVCLSSVSFRAGCLPVCWSSLHTL